MKRALVLLCIVAPGGAAQKLKIDVPVAELEARAARDSNDAVAHYNLALGYWSKRRWDEADASLRRSAALDPRRFAPTDLAIAYLPLASGRGGPIEWLPAGGGWWWVRFVARDSVPARRPALPSRVYARPARGHPHCSSIRVPGCLAALRLDKPADAVRDLQWLVEWSQHREQSDTLFRFSLRTNEYRYALGYAKQKAGDLNGAVDTYQETLVADVGLFPAHLPIAEIYEGARQWDPAITARRNAINANPDDPGLQLDLGWTLAKAGRFAEAEDPLRDAIQRAPHDGRAVYYLRIVQQQLGKGAEARASFERFIQIAPSRYERQVADARQRLTVLR